MRYLICIFVAILIGAVPAAAQVPPFRANFRIDEVATTGATIHVRIGGKGPAVVLLHGYGETGDMWAPMAADLMRDHTVIVPDLRGLACHLSPRLGSTKRRKRGT